LINPILSVQPGTAQGIPHILIRKQHILPVLPSPTPNIRAQHREVAWKSLRGAAELSAEKKPIVHISALISGKKSYMIHMYKYILFTFERIGVLSEGDAHDP
jgi:hypothetical protein